MDEIMSEPWHIQWTFGSLKAVLFCLFIYFMGIGIWLSTRRNYRRGEEHGSAKWGDAAAVNRKYRQRPDNMNKILTQNVRIGFDAHKHRRNLNVLVIGGSGAGKTRFYVKPNVMQANCSMVILDPKGQLKYARALNLPLKFTYFRERRWQKWLNLRLYGILPSTSDSLKMMNLRVNLTVFPIRKST
ncbi:MAG: type IV secretory system conjugative DNA transfer family protein, partial [Methanocorpusculum sp.]|nr:type IV secretory system conjugative DNA transfer family protein [Methanocorpusculum sp.]